MKNIKTLSAAHARRFLFFPQQGHRYYFSFIQWMGAASHRVSLVSVIAKETGILPAKWRESQNQSNHKHKLSTEPERKRRRVTAREKARKRWVAVWAEDLCYVFVASRRGHGQHFHKRATRENTRRWFFSLETLTSHKRWPWKVASLHT